MYEWKKKKKKKKNGNRNIWDRINFFICKYNKIIYLWCKLDVNCYNNVNTAYFHGKGT